MTDPDTRLLDSRIEAALSASGVLAKQGGGSHTGGMDAWQTSVETRLTQLHTDIGGVRGDMRTQLFWLLGTLGALGAAGVAAFLYMLGRMDNLNTTLQQILQGL